MKSPRIEIRDLIVELVKKIPEFNDKNVSLYKMDRVDKTPAASVYLGRMGSELTTMGGESNTYSRDIGIMVDFHSDDGLDADAQTDCWLVELESLIYKAQETGALSELLEDIDLTYAEFHPTSTGRERMGDLVTMWRAEFSETLTLS